MTEVRGHLRIQAIEARKPPKGITGKANCYLVFSVRKQQKLKTKPVLHKSNPKWNQEFTFTATEGDELSVELWDHSRFTPDTMIGFFTVPFSEIHENIVNDSDPQSSNISSTDRWFRVKKKKDEEIKETETEVHLDISFWSTEEKISSKDFELLSVLGKGKFGKVMQVQKKQCSTIYAMKVIKKKSVNKVQNVMSEKNILKTINHPFIIMLKYTFQDEKNLYFVLEFVPGGDLYFHLRREGFFKEERACFYASIITLALEHLHSLGIIYRDLKPENVLMDSNGYIKLTDFGLSKVLENPDDRTGTVCGTGVYLAPEIVMKSKYNKEIDWWTLGIMTYEMLSGLPPFSADNKLVMYQKILNDEPKFPKMMPTRACRFIQGLLNKDPTQRLGSGDIDSKAVKSHDFFGKVDWDKLLRKEIVPPFKPTLKNDKDTSHFESVYTKEKPKLQESVGSSGRTPTHHFDDFSFVKESGYMP